MARRDYRGGGVEIAQRFDHGGLSVLVDLVQDDHVGGRDLIDRNIVLIVYVEKVRDIDGRGNGVEPNPLVE